MTWVKWNLATFYLETVLESVQDRCMVCTRRTIGSEILLEARFGLLNIELILTQDRCTVCVEHTIGLEIILDAPNGTPR